MPTPSVTITLDDVNEELRISTGTSISMSDTNVRNLARDTSGAISMSSLRNKSIVTGAGANVFCTIFGAGVCESGIWWGEGGTMQTIVANTFQGIYSNFWSFIFDDTPPVLGAEYELRVTQTKAPNPFEASVTSDFSLSSWVSLDTARRLNLVKDGGAGFTNADFTATIREADTSINVVTTSFTLTVERA